MTKIPGYPEGRYQEQDAIPDHLKGVEAHLRIDMPPGYESPSPERPDSTSILAELLERIESEVAEMRQQQETAAAHLRVLIGNPNTSQETRRKLEESLNAILTEHEQTSDPKQILIQRLGHGRKQPVVSYPETPGL